MYCSQLPRRKGIGRAGTLDFVWHHHPRVFPRSSGTEEKTRCATRNEALRQQNLLPLQQLSFSRQLFVAAVFVLQTMQHFHR